MNIIADSLSMMMESNDTEPTALSVTQNGTYTAPTGKAYSPVTVDVQVEHCYELPIPPIPPVNPDDPDPFPFIGSNKVTDEDLNASYQVGFTTDDFATFQNVTKLEVTSEPIDHIQIGVKVISTSGGTQSISYYAVTGYWAFYRVGYWIEIMNIYITSDGKTHGHFKVHDAAHSPDPQSVREITIQELIGWGDPNHTYTVTNT